MADRRVIDAIIREGQRRHSPKKTKAALQTGIVETGLENLKGGDADSVNWRQERASIYGGDMSITRSVRRFFDEAEKLDRPGLSAAELAARVQRPAAQYRGRYGEARIQDDVNRYLQAYYGGKLPAVSGSTSGSSSRSIINTTRERTTMDTKGFEQARRQAILGNFIAKRNPQSFLLRSGVLGTQAPNPADFQETKVVGGLRLGARRASPSSRTSGSPSSQRGTFKITGPSPGRLKPYLVSFAERVAGEYGRPLVGSDGSGHSVRTATGGISQHTSGEATDIPASGRTLLRMGRAALIAAGMPREQAMKEKGGLYNINGHQIIFHDRQQVSGSPHDDHLHISAKPVRRRKRG